MQSSLRSRILSAAHRSVCRFRSAFGSTLALATLLVLGQAALAQPVEAEQCAEMEATVAEDIVAAALDLTRGDTSYTEMSMTISRPAWQRSSTLKAVTRGREDALIHFTAPAKDAGNGTLKKGDQMWTFTPKLGRTIRLPYSLMAQSWAGSDFSYNDLSRSDQILNHYDLELVSSDCVDAHWQHLIEAVPRDDAPVVWGKEAWLLREDAVILEQTFFDQDLQPLKRLQTLDIGELGGRVMPLRMRMGRLDAPDEWTELVYEVAKFDQDVPDSTFTLFALKNGG